AVRLLHDDRTADVDAQFLELVRIKKTVTIVADTANECGGTSELRKGNNRIRYRPAARQLRLMLLIALKQLLLFSKVDQLFATPFKAQRCELLFGNFKEDVDESIA